MTSPFDEPADLELRILQAGVQPEDDGSYRLLLRTTRGDITGLLNVCEGETGAALFVGGAGGGGLSGPADGIYERLAPVLAGRGVTSLRLNYRHPGREDTFDECVLDAMGGLSFLKGVGAERIVVIGHSYGGGVVLRAAELAPHVSAVVAMSSQLHGSEGVATLAPRPLLLVHGLDDQVLEATSSEMIYAQAGEPKRLVLYAEAGHSLYQCREELFELLSEWIPAHARGESAGKGA